MSVFIMIFLIGAWFLFGQAQKQEEKPWDWDLKKVRTMVEQVRAGKDLTPQSWPGGAKVAVALSFDFDSETNALRDMNISPGAFSQGEYAARVSMPRIHERNSLISEEIERRLMKRSYETLKAATGKAPTGIRTPSWDFSPSTLKLIRELGLVYDSSLMADDRPYELVEDGKPTGIVELPVEWLLDDYPYFGFSRYSSVRPHIKPMDVFEIWASEFERAYEEGTLFVLTMHPKYIGHRSRIAMLEELIKHMQNHKGVWFATHEDIALYARKGIKN